MSARNITRRDFVAEAARTATAGAIVLQLPWLATLAGCSRERPSETFVHLTPAEASAMRAFAEQIIPSDDGTPGAVSVGAVQFVDRALGAPFFASSAPLIRGGLADLDARARAMRGGRSGFAGLTSAQQIAVLRQIEREPFFAAARTLVLIGTFAAPSYGGNRDGAGWTMIGMEHRPSYAAPFGWYDAQARSAT